jgi:hypothetical protein
MNDARKKASRSTKPTSTQSIRAASSFTLSGVRANPRVTVGTAAGIGSSGIGVASPSAAEAASPVFGELAGAEGSLLDDMKIYLLFQTAADNVE